MTTLVILSVVVLLSSVVIVLLLYAVGKIRSIEEFTKQFMTQDMQSDSAGAHKTGPFSGLQGKALWDMLAEKNLPADVSQSDLDTFRTQYNPILLKTIKSVFSEGVSDSKYGQPRGTPKNDRSIKTLRLEITSWLPSQELSSLYNLGYDSVHADHDEQARLRKTFDEVVGSLFSKIKTPAPGGLANSLFADDTSQLTTDAQVAHDGDSANMSPPEVAQSHEEEGGSTSKDN